MSTSLDSPTIFTIFGITGDLAAKKIIPSLWHLQKQNRLPSKFSIYGFGRRTLSPEEFESMLRKSIEKAAGSAVADKDFADFYALFEYHSGLFEEESSYKALAMKIAEKEKMWNVCASKLYYLAVPSSTYEPIFKGLASAGLNLTCQDHDDQKGWTRILVEKPFGYDLQSAQTLTALLSSYFTEEQIYQIDHYLFKEIVQGIENFRFSNTLFEHTWNNTNIERIDIRLHESIGIESRGNFYDEVGALRDVGQNHILSMLAAVTMEYPPQGHRNTAGMRSHRAEILAALKPWTTEGIQHGTYRAQYDHYKDTPGVCPDSTTETYFALQTELTNKRWAGVPIFLEAGKSMNHNRKEIVLTYRHPTECVLCDEGTHGPNRIVFRLEPNDEIVIHFWTKKPGFDHVVEERTFSFFLYEKTERAPFVEEYAKVIHAAIAGEQSLFISSTEIEILWKFIDPIHKAWEENLVPLNSYTPGTNPQPFASELKQD